MSPYLFGFTTTSSSPTWTRTTDMVINSHPLYQLSYRGICRTTLGSVLGNHVGAVNLSADSAWARLREISWAAITPALRGDLLPAIGAVLSGAPAERALDRFLRSHPDLSPDQRRASAEAVFGIGLWRRRLAALLGSP